MSRFRNSPLAKLLKVITPKPHRLLVSQLLLLFAVAALSLAPTCGKRKPPLPPLERIPQRTEFLSGAQRGNQVILIWPAPRRNAGEGSVQSIRRIDVYRVAERPNSPLSMTEEEFGARATVVGSVPYSEIKNGSENLSYIDALEMAGVPARLRYAVRFVNAAGQSAAFSNFLLIEPAAKVAEPPANVRGEESEAAITINWEAPKANIDGSTPVNLLGYNIYRATASQPEVSQKPINQDLIATTKYQDRTFKFGQRYTYLVRTVSLGTEGKPVESLNSNSVEASPVDKYAPSAPGQISPAASPGRISIFWPANPEGDVAGYTIWRSTDPNLPKGSWTKLTPTLYTRTTFTDENVEAGKTYYYYITATDTSRNTSPPSEVVSETVP